VTGPATQRWIDVSGRLLATDTMNSTPTLSNTRSTGVSDPGELDIAAVRTLFPILYRSIHGYPLVYLDNAASSQRPQRVIDRISRYYQEEHANVHRGVHELSTHATAAYEDARTTIAEHIGAPDRSEVVFTRGTTESINLVAGSWGLDHLEAGDEVVLTKMEHHSNIVPWQLVAERRGAVLRFMDVTPEGRLDLDDLDRLLGPRTRLVGVTHVSNSLGTINPIAEIARRAHEVGALVLVDGAQAVPHFRVDVAALGCDFYAFSAHKMCGPTGTGALWARRALLEDMPPYQGGGEMISEVRLDGSSWAEVPHKFEAGTPNIAGVIGFGEAVRFLNDVGFDAILSHERALTAYALERLRAVPELRLYGPPDDRVSVFSFTYGDIHPHDLSTILDQRGIAIRAGHHCNQPLMDHMGVAATARASLYLYNTREDVDALIDGLAMAAEVFGGVS
jgi:cysteine desulfurase/selenocysteine lyase